MGPLILLSYTKPEPLINCLHISISSPTIRDPLVLHKPSSNTLIRPKVQQVFQLAIEMKQDIEAEMKDEANGGWEGYGGSVSSIHLRAT